LFQHFRGDVSCNTANGLLARLAFRQFGYRVMPESMESQASGGAGDLSEIGLAGFIYADRYRLLQFCRMPGS
jgi:hypothetical protein